MRIYICTLFCILLTIGRCFGQQPFYQEFNLDGNTLFSNVIELDGVFYVSGHGLDIEDSVTVRREFVRKYNASGLYLASVSTFDNDSTLQTRAKGMSQIDAQTFLVAYKVIKGIEGSVRLRWFNTALEITNEMEILPPSDVELTSSAGIGLQALSISDSHIYVSLNTHRNDNEDGRIVKLDHEGNVLWDRDFVRPSSNWFTSIQEQNDTLFAAEIRRIVELDGNPLSHVLMQLDEDGEVLSEFVLMFTYDHSKNIGDFMVDDEGIVCIGGGAREPEVSVIPTPMIYKLNRQGQELWTSFPPTTPFLEQFTVELEQTCDGGYIMCGHEHVWGPDSSFTFNYNVMLGRYAHDGTFLWKRNFEFVGTQDFNNRIADLISTSDGGFAAVGYHVNSDLDNPYPEGEPAQKAWFLKVDECGCLVPGCDPNCSTEVCPESPFLLGEDTFIIGPNPAQSHLNIYLGEREETGHFELRNVQGQLIQSFTAAKGNTTYVLETATYAEGMYVLSYMNAQGDVLQSVRVMVVE